MLKSDKKLILKPKFGVINCNPSEISLIGGVKVKQRDVWEEGKAEKDDQIGGDAAGGAGLVGGGHCRGRQGIRSRHRWRMHPLRGFIKIYTKIQRFLHISSYIDEIRAQTGMKTFLQHNTSAVIWFRRGISIILSLNNTYSFEFVF